MQQKTGIAMSKTIGAQHSVAKSDDPAGKNFRVRARYLIELCPLERMRRCENVTQARF